MTDKLDHILTHILDSLNRLDETLSSVREDIARIDERVEMLEKTVDKLAHIVIEGNGKPSLVSRVDQIAVHLESQGKTADMVGSWKMAEVEQGRNRVEVVKAFAPYVGGLLAIVSLILQMLAGVPSVSTPPEPVPDSGAP